VDSACASVKNDAYRVTAGRLKMRLWGEAANTRLIINATPEDDTETIICSSVVVDVRSVVNAVAALITAQMTPKPVASLAALRPTPRQHNNTNTAKYNPCMIPRAMECARELTKALG
jgi:hypothetical protein